MPVLTVISTIRHGHTRYNAEKRYAGSLDVPLDEQGRRESQIAAGKLAKIKFEVIITSTMSRASETARILAAGQIPIIKNKLCNERNFGIMEGCTWDEVQKLDPPVLFIKVGDDRHSVNPKGGEPFEDLWQRAVKFRRFLFKDYAGKNILVVTHGVFMQMFHGVLRGLSCIESLAAYPANLELTSFRFFDGRLTGEEINKLIDPSSENF